MSNPVVTLNSSTVVGNISSACSGIPAHQHIQVWTLTTGLIDSVPQKEIRAVEVRCVSCTTQISLFFTEKLMVD